jgi:hypothetical protein
MCDRGQRGSQRRVQPPNAVVVAFTRPEGIPIVELADATVVISQRVSKARTQA